MTEGLTFDADAHTYKLGDRRLPGITEILRAAGLLDAFASIPDEYKERGARIHRAIAYDIEGDLGECDPADLPYVEAARRARKELKLTVSQVEHLCCDPALGFATHVDAYGGIHGDPVIVNWKTSATAVPGYAIQMAGEALAVCGDRSRCVTRIGVHLTGNGKYKVVNYEDRKDFDVFLAALRIWQFKEEHK